MRCFLLFFNTLRYLKWKQIYFRFVRKLIKPKVTEYFQEPKPKRSKTWKHLPLYGSKIDNQLEACFLNHAKKLDLPADWNNESHTKLWVYNLHYFEDLLSNNATEKQSFHLELLNSWVDQNPVGYGNGWEPYPTSLRIVNILKAWLGGLELDEKLLSSVFAQASFLSNDLERHLLGNHYFVNLKALLFAGVIFENTRWLNIAEKGLISEIPEQILEDGANFELSPMYHLLILVDMLDMLNLSKAYPGHVPEKLVSLLKYFIPKMLAFMEAMTHPDSGVSLFNDSADGIAPSKAKIGIYAKKLGFESNPLDLNKIQIIDNFDSGYICATHSGNKLIFDASPIGPDYIPAHSHADTLSFEFSLGKERIFVNSGTSEYGDGDLRHNQRRTKAHNTVEIDGRDSSEVWGTFRVAKRARILERNSTVNRDHSITMISSHNGYQKKNTGCIHKRKIVLGYNELIIKDSIYGAFNSAVARFYFHPNLHVEIEENFLMVRGKNFLMKSNLKGIQANLMHAEWYPEFGLIKKNKVLEVNYKSSIMQLRFKWSKSEGCVKY